MTTRLRQVVGLAAAVTMARCACAEAADGGAWTVGWQAGWNRPGLGAIRDDGLDRVRRQTRAWTADHGGTAGGDASFPAGGLLLGWQTMFRAWPHLAFGLRGTYNQPRDGLLALDATGDAGEARRWRETDSTAAFSLLAGMTGRSRIAGPLAASLSAFAGPAVGVLNRHGDLSFQDPANEVDEQSDYAATADGAGLAWEVVAGLHLEVGRGSAVTIEAGWQAARLTTLHWVTGTGVDETGDPAGTPGAMTLRAAGLRLEEDFGGFAARVGWELQL